MGKTRFLSTPIEPDLKSIELLCRNVDLIFRHLDIVEKNPDWHDIHVEGLGTESNFVGRLDLLLGDLIRLWGDGTPWIHVRDDESVLVYRAVGSVVSDYNFVYGWDRNRHEFKNFRPGVHFTRFYLPAAMLVRGRADDATGHPLIGTGIIARKPPQRGRSDRTVAELLTALNALEGRYEN